MKPIYGVLQILVLFCGLASSILGADIDLPVSSNLDKRGHHRPIGFDVDERHYNELCKKGSASAYNDKRPRACFRLEKGIVRHIGKTSSHLSGYISSNLTGENLSSRVLHLTHCGVDIRKTLVSKELLLRLRILTRSLSDSSGF